MKIAIDSNDRQFLERLHELAEGTVQSICAALGVTATAVRARLTRLQERGLVVREAVSAGRGRPHHVYRVSEAGLRLLGDNYADLALILWREIRNIEEPELRARLFHRVENALVGHYSQQVDAKGPGTFGRFAQLRDALVDRGFDVDVDSRGQLPVLRENNCPYLELASNDPEICELEQAVFSRVLGADVRLTQCCLDGHHCCEFQVATAGGAAGEESETGSETE